MEIYLSYILTSLLIGMFILILLEKKKKIANKEEKTQNTAFNNTTMQSPTQEGVKESTEPKREEMEKETTKPEETKEMSQESNASASSSCSSSGSDEEANRPLKVSKKPKKKHACKGSVILCATKRKVTAVTIVTDSEEEEVKVSLEELAGELRDNGVTCNVHPALTHLPSFISTEPSHLLLLFGTTSKGCEGLEAYLRTALGGDGALPLPQPFLYTVSCWSDAAAGEVFESAHRLNGSLASYGGAEWLPIACITTAQGDSDPVPPVMTQQQYVRTVMDKITKPGKKCCGTSCGSKTVDIEDVATSLLLSRAAVTS